MSLFLLALPLFSCFFSLQQEDVDGQMDVESCPDPGGYDDSKFSHVPQPDYGDLNVLQDVLCSSPTYAPMTNSNLINRLSVDDIRGPTRMDQWAQSMSHQGPTDFQVQNYAAQHGFRFGAFESHSSHSLPQNFRINNNQRHQTQQPLVISAMSNNSGQQAQQQSNRPMHHPFHQRSRSHHLTSTQSFNHSPSPSRCSKCCIHLSLQRSL